MTDWTRDTKKTRQWQRDNFQAWQDSLPAARLSADREMLEKIFAKVEFSPTLKVALEWARANDIVFYIDHTTNLAGHYHAGTGVVAVARGAQADTDTLVHEIRHAWQDAHGLLDGVLGEDMRYRRFGDQLIRLSLFEADAFAHGELAGREAFIASQITRLSNVVRLFKDKPRQGQDIRPVRKLLRRYRAEQRDLPKHRDEMLRGYFLKWFSDGFTMQFYGASLRDSFAEALGTAGSEKPDYKVEFAEASAAFQGQLDPRRLEEVLKFGKAFGGGNYLAGFDRDILLRNILSPAAAETLYDPRQKPVDPVVRDIRRQHLRIKAGRA